jgi:hypothetical protein
MLRAILQGAAGMASIFRNRFIETCTEFHPAAIARAAPAKKILRTACSARWWRIGSDNPDSHAVQAALVIGDARPHAPDRLLGSLDLILAEHDDRASSTPGRAIPHPGLHYWI